MIPSSTLLPSPLLLVLMVTLLLILPTSTLSRRPSPNPAEEANNLRIVNGQDPIDFSSPSYPLEELGFPSGATPTKLPTPEVYPGSMHLDYPMPLTVLTEFTPTSTYPYMNQKVHYKICAYNKTKCDINQPMESGGPSRNWRSINVGETLDLSPDNVDDWEPGLSLTSILIRRPIRVTISLFASSGWDGDRDPSLNSTMHASDSNVMTRDYYVSDGIQGMAYIVPNFNGKKFTGDMVELDLETAKYSTVRIHGIESDFADFYSKSAVEADGVDPYVKETSKSGTDQVIIKRLETLDPDLAGFHGGFSALYNDISYGFLVPYFNGVNHHGKVVRVYCGTYNSSKTDEWEEGTTFREFRTKMTSGEFEEFQQDIDFSSLDVIDLTSVDPDLKGFLGGFNHGAHAYFVPFMNGKYYFGKVVRVHVHTFDLSSVEVLDLTQKDKRLAGFYGGFATNLQPGNPFTPSANYAYLSPYKNMIGKVNGANTKYTVDGYKDYDIFDNQEAYGGDHLLSNEHGMLVRINLDTFDVAGVDFIDLTTIDPDLKGFSGGFQGGSRGYLVPYSKGFGDYASKVVRFSLLDFSVDSVEVLDLAQKDDQLMGFAGGFSYGTHVVFVPYQNGRQDVNFRQRNQFSILTRVDMNNFDVSGIKTMDVAKIYRKNTPDYPDNNLRGFVSGFPSGSFIYLVPHFNGMWHGKMVRVDMRDFDILSDLQISGESTDLVTGYKGVQELDMGKYYSGLVGFSGGFVRQRPPPVDSFYRVNEKIFNYATGLDKDALTKGVAVQNIMPEGGSAREGEGELDAEGRVGGEGGDSGGEGGTRI